MWLQKQREAADGVDITYKTEHGSVTLPAVRGKIQIRSDENQGAVILDRMEDFLVRRELLVINDSKVTPKPSDLIEISQSGITTQYRVSEPGGIEECYRPSDETGETIRIHTSRLGTSE